MGDAYDESEEEAKLFEQPVTHKIKHDEEFEHELMKNARPFVSKSDTLNINASSIGGCLRAMWYQKKGYIDERGKNTVDEQYFIYFLGNNIEDGIAKLLAHIRIDKGKCRIRDYQTNISGEVDRVILETIDGKLKPVVVEVKTAWEFQFRNMYKDLFQNQLMNKSHYSQIQTYLKLEPRFEYARYILLNKNMHVGTKELPPFVVFRVDRDEVEQAKITKWIHDHIESLKSDEPPPIQYPKSHWQCKPQYCGFCGVCRNGEQSTSLARTVPS